jgi:hypothetical protein
MAAKWQKGTTLYRKSDGLKVRVVSAQLDTGSNWLYTLEDENLRWLEVYENDLTDAQPDSYNLPPRSAS